MSSCHSSGQCARRRRRSVTGDEKPLRLPNRSGLSPCRSGGRLCAEFPVARVSLAGHSRPVTEDEAKAVAAVAVQCVTWGGWRRWSPVMRYGRLFTPGTDVGGGAYPMSSDYVGRNALSLVISLVPWIHSAGSRTRSRADASCAW